MVTLTESSYASKWITLAYDLGEQFGERAKEYDDSDTFVKENYDALKQHDVFSAMIPEELGGGGISHGMMCDFLRILGRYCGSTALALSMHQHLIAANVWKYNHQNGGEKLLRKVAEEQLVLVSTGAKDWLESNGKMVKTEGGYLLNAKKHFASQSQIGDLLVTSAPFKDPDEGWQVLHFPVPLKKGGVTLMDNWYTMGMRGTGSHTVKLEEVFVPESDIVLRRPRGVYHMVWNVVLTVAMPLITAVYVGIAEKAAEIAIEFSGDSLKEKPYIPYLVGEMHNALTSAQVFYKDMVSITNNFKFEPDNQKGNAILTRKTLVINACLETVNKAKEITGGRSFFRNIGFERLFRDVQAGSFHPLPEKEQHLFSGRYLMGLSPVEENS